MSDLPVLVFFSMEGCAACKVFEKEWSKIVSTLSGKCRFHKFVLKNRLQIIPEPLRKYVTWFPSIFLVGGKSYSKLYTKRNMIVPGFDPQLQLVATKYDAVTDENGVIVSRSGKVYRSDMILRWFVLVAENLIKEDTRLG